MQTLILQIQYDGTNYSGWQTQPNAVTIQGKICDAFAKIGLDDFPLIAAGRTDAGVHARNMTASSALTDKFPIPEDKICRALNSCLPKDIRIVDALICEGKFHARFDALSREYSYHLLTKADALKGRYAYYSPFRLDIAKLFQAAAIFRGVHDFTSFSKRNDELTCNICRIEKCYWEKQDEHHYVLRIKSTHFLYGMVRSLVGAMIDAARGKRSLQEITLALASLDRSLNSPLAPANGLIFEKADYKTKFDLIRE